MDWSSIINTFLKGSFSIIVVRSVIDGIRHSFTSRSREVLIARLLRSDIEATIGRVTSFHTSLQSMILRNQGITNRNFQLDARSLPPITGTYTQNYSEIYRLMNKYSPDSVQDLNSIFAMANNYDALLGSYRQLFLSVSGVNFNNDPNIRYQTLFNSFALLHINNYAPSTYEALNKIEKGSKTWQILKNKQLYKFIALISSLLLISIPDKDLI